MNKSLVPECPTIIDVRSFTVNISRRFFLRFRTPVSLLKRRSSHSVAVNSPHFRDIPKIRRFWRLFVTSFASLLCDCRSAAPATASLLFRSCCVVVEYTPATVSIFFSPRTSPRFRNILRKFDGVWRHSNHRSLCVVLIVSLSSSTPATISPHFRSVLLRKFDGFSVIYPSFALCCAFCVVVESHSSHSSLLLRQGR